MLFKDVEPFALFQMCLSFWKPPSEVASESPSKRGSR